VAVAKRAAMDRSRVGFTWQREENVVLVFFAAIRLAFSFRLRFVKIGGDGQSKSTAMSNSDSLKCACPGCGGRIEFPAGRAGELVDCPHCGAQTKLISNTKKLPTRPTRKLAIVAGAILIALALVAVGVEFFWRDLQQSDAPPAMAVTPAITNVFIPKAFTEFNDFKINKITLKKSGDGGLIYAVGILKNDTGRQRFGVKVELDLHDAQDVKIGSTSDYVAVIEPHRQWQFQALLTDPRAVKAVLTQIEEQK
jgi:hypothetical protein